MWDLSSQTRDSTWAAAVKMLRPNPQTTRELPFTANSLKCFMTFSSKVGKKAKLLADTLIMGKSVRLCVCVCVCVCVCWGVFTDVLSLLEKPHI